MSNDDTRCSERTPRSDDARRSGESRTVSKSRPVTVHGVLNVPRVDTAGGCRVDAYGTQRGSCPVRKCHPSGIRQVDAGWMDTVRRVDAARYAMATQRWMQGGGSWYAEWMLRGMQCSPKGGGRVDAVPGWMVPARTGGSPRCVNVKQAGAGWMHPKQWWLLDRQGWIVPVRWRGSPRWVNVKQGRVPGRLIRDDPLYPLRGKHCVPVSGQH